MPQYRVTFLFQASTTPPVGFSESWEMQFASDNLAAAAVPALVAKRATWLADGWVIAGARLSLLAITAGTGGKCKITYSPVLLAGCVLNVPGALSANDNPYAAIYFQFKRGSTGKRRVYLARGVPDTWFANGGVSIPAADGNKFLSWFNYMKNSFSFGKAVGNAPTCNAITIDPYTEYCLKRFASRRVGRPFGLLRGRRSPTT